MNYFFLMYNIQNIIYAKSTSRLQRRDQIIYMLTITKGVFFKRLLYSFPLYLASKSISEQKKNQMKLEAQDAAVIIRLLGNYPNSQINSTNSFQSLTEIIKSKIKSQRMIQLLDPRQGIILPNNLRNQDRITSSQQKQNKFTFFPNRIVTTPIFQLILKKDRKRLIHGPPGSSKTISIIFFTYLAQIITQYQFQFDQIIANDIPRIFYLNYEDLGVQIEKQEDLKQLKKNINDHVTRMIRLNLPTKLSNKFKQINSISELYLEMRIQFMTRRGLNIKFVIDQFNRYIQLVKQYNSQFNGKRLPNFKLKRQKLKIQSELWFKIAHSHSQNNVIYNSSQNIQDVFLKRISQPFFSYDLNYHEPLPKVPINFYQNIQKSSGKKEIISILFFQLERLCPNQNFIKIKQAERSFFKNFEANVKNSQWIIFTHFQIREYLNKNKELYLLLNPSKNENELDIQKQIEKIISDLYENKINQIRQLSKSFCFNNLESVQIKTKKLKILIAVRSILQERIRIKKEDQDQNHEQFSYSSSDIQAFTVQQIKSILGIREQAKYEIDPSIIDKNIFQFQNLNWENTVNLIRLKWSFENFLEMSNYVQTAIEQIKREDIQLFLDTFFQDLSESASATSLYFDIIKTKSIEADIQLKFKQQKYSKTFLFKKNLKFLHFNAFPLFMGLQERFKEFMIEAEKYQIIAGTPLTNLNKKSVNSTSIDFLIFKKREADSGFLIYSFDLTFTKEKITEKHEKVAKATELIKNIFQKYQGRVEKLNRKGKISQLDQQQVQIKNQIEKKLKGDFNPQIKNWIHIIVCNQDQLMKTSFQVPISNVKNLYANITIQTSNATQFDIILEDKKHQKSIRYSTILQKIKKQLRKKELSK